MSQPIFLSYDREALDREYNNRAKVPNATAMLERYARESAGARSALPCRLDLPYGPHPGETLDVFPAAGASAAPIQLFIHGGYWHRLDKADFSYVARAFQPRGATVVVINYALMPHVPMAELVRQCRASAAWVYEHADEIGGDRDRLFVSGHSAGGHLVAMLLATDWPEFGLGQGTQRPLPRDLVKAGCAISGLYDLEPIRLCYLNEVLGLGEDDVRGHSPVLLTPGSRARLTLAVGGLEGPEYHRQTDALAAAWRGHGTPIEVMDLAGHDHFSVVAELALSSSPLSEAILEQMGLGSRARG